MIEINAPIWNTRTIGIATFRVRPGKNLIKVTCKDKDGNKLYPDTYELTGEEIRKFPVDTVRSCKAIKLYMVPISEMRVHNA